MSTSFPPAPAGATPPPAPAGSTSDPEPTQPVLVPVLLAVLGSVAGTLAGKYLEADPSLNLVAAAVGAAIPPLVSVAGPYSALRAAAGALIAVAALVLTYTGFTVSDALRDEPATFPVPAALEVDGGADPGGAASSGGETGGGEGEGGNGEQVVDELTTCEGELCITISTPSVVCTTTGCEPAVVVSSTGSVPLTVTSVEVEGDGAGRFGHDGGCAPGTTLGEGAQCTLRVTYTPGEAAAQATLVIHQNLAGPATRVVLQGEGGPVQPESDLDLVPASLDSCSVVPGGSLSGADGLTIFVGVRNLGPGTLDRLVPYTLTSDLGPSGGGNTGVGTTGLTGMQVDLVAQDYGKRHRFTIVVDPLSEIAESDETNNVLPVDVDLPGAVPETRDVPCSVP